MTIRQLNQNEKLSYLQDLISFKDPSWVTQDTWKSHIDNFEFLRKKLDNKEMFIEYVGNSIGCQLSNDFNVHPRDGFITIPVSAGQLYTMYNTQRVISPPTTGQDPKKPPKTLHNSNVLKNASYHFGNFWGDEFGSFFLNNGNMNFSLFEDEKTGDIFGCGEPTDLEHRLVGGIAGILSIVPLPEVSDFQNKKLFFESPKLKEGKIQVNGLTIDGIVTESNKNLKTEDNPVTREDVIRRANQGKININFLPMFTAEECQVRFEQLNSNESKTPEQMLHASTVPIVKYLKKNSSIKVHQFQGDDNYFHPLFELYSNDDKYNLKTLIDGSMIFLTINNSASSNGGMLDTNKSSIIDKIKQQKFENEERYESMLDRLYIVCKEFKNTKISSQILSILMKIFRWLDEKKKNIVDHTQFGNEFETHITRLRNEDELMEHNLGNGKASKHIDVFNEIEINFLSRGNEVGIFDNVKKTPRFFTKNIIDSSAKKEKYIDICGTPFNTNYVGGHEISDFEILRLTDEELNSIVDGEFKHENNCRAMSAYHNRRMGVLRLAEYLPIIDQSDETVRRKEREKYEELKKRPIIRH